MLFSGKHVILYDANLKYTELEHLVQYTGTEQMRVSAEFLDEPEEVREKFSMKLFYQQEDEAADEVTPVYGDFICFTSGTSKSSKGVVIEPEALAKSMLCVPELVPGEQGERFFFPIPMHHIYGLTSTFHILTKGGSVCIGRGPRYFLPEIMKFKPQAAFLVPTLVQYLIKSGKVPQELHSIITGAGFCSKELEADVHRLGAELYNAYGLSETLGMICLSGKEKGIEWLKPAEGVRFSEEKDGEIRIHLPFHMKEYYNKKDATDSVLNGDDFWTGDIGKTDAEGYVHIKGRIRDTLVLQNGEKIHAEDEDRMLAAIPGAKEAAAISVNGKLEAVVVIGPGDSQEEIQKQFEELNRKKPIAHRYAKVWITQKKLPRTSTGKLKRYQLEEEYQAK